MCSICLPLLALVLQSLMPVRHGRWPLLQNIGPVLQIDIMVTAMGLTPNTALFFFVERQKHVLYKGWLAQPSMNYPVPPLPQPAGRQGRKFHRNR